MKLNLPPITLGLIIACFATYVAQQHYGAVITRQFALWPFGPFFRIWQPVSYFFLHTSDLTLILDMFGLYMFGQNLERFWGAQRYLALILISTMTAALTQQLVTYANGAIFPLLGAGSLGGLIVAFALSFRDGYVLPLFLPIPMKPWVFVALIAAFELFCVATSTLAHNAHLANLGGMLGAALLIALWRFAVPATQP